MLCEVFPRLDLRIFVRNEVGLFEEKRDLACLALKIFVIRVSSLRFLANSVVLFYQFSHVTKGIFEFDKLLDYEFEFVTVIELE